jgi:tetratricopeptide (TPR) repeat protein
MKRPPLLPLTAFAFVLLLGAAPPPSPEALLKQADAALLAEDFTRAIELYEKAEPRADDPGRVTFYLATAKYRRALQDNSATDFADAERLYACLLDEDNPRRAAALFGVSNCLLEKAGGRDKDLVLEAIEQYRQCLDAAKAAKDEKLTADAEYNLELARLLHNQIRKAEEDKPPEDPPRDRNTDPKRSQPNRTDRGADPSTHDPRDPRVGHTPAGVGDPKTDPGGKPIETDSQPQPGAGKLPPVPDQPDQPPLSAREALEHLKQANEHIWRERHQHRLSITKLPPGDVRDW